MAFFLIHEVNKKIMKKIFLLTLLISGVVMSCATIKNGKMIKKKTYSAKEELKVFPKAKEGMVRHVFFLPKLSSEEEAKRKIEIFAGKEELLDCNNHGLDGKLETVNLEGYGYNYYVLKTEGHIFSTMMMCPDRKRTMKFITAPTVMTYYNSKLPLVIYTPKDCKVYYKIWTTNNLLGKER